MPASILNCRSGYISFYFIFGSESVSSGAMVGSPAIYMNELDYSSPFLIFSVQVLQYQALGQDQDSPLKYYIGGSIS